MRISKKTRALTLILALMMIATCLFTSCNEDTSSDTQTQETSSKTTQENTTGKEGTVGPPCFGVGIDEWLPITDYGENGGAGEINYLIYTTYAHNYMLVQQDDSEDPLRSEAYSRTQKVQELFNVYLNVIENNDITGTLQASLMGQGGEFDIVYPHPDNATPITQNHLATDLYTYENVHLDQPWWNQSVDTFTIDGRLYFAASDYSICGQGLGALIYNRDLWKQLQLDYDINALVQDYEWTIATFREIIMQYGSDADNNDVYDLNDQYGFLFSAPTSFYWSMGGRVIEKDANENYYLAIDIDRISAMAEAMCALVHSSDNKTFTMPGASWGQFPTSPQWAAYKTGNSLFMQYELGSMFNLLPDVPFDIGYAPLPLLDSEQTSYNTLCGAGFFILPGKSEDPVRNSIILEALCIESYEKFRPTFFHTILLGRLSNLEEDYEMLELLHESKVYDLGYTWSSGGSAWILKVAVDDNDPGSIASYVRGRWKDMEGTLDFIDEIRAGFYGDESTEE